MERYEIKKYINQAVGSEGNLKIPAWWMNKILTGIIDSNESSNEIVNNKIQDLKSELYRTVNSEIIELEVSPNYLRKNSENLNLWKESGGLRIIKVIVNDDQQHNILHGAISNPISYINFIKYGAEVSVSNSTISNTECMVKALFKVTSVRNARFIFENISVIGGIHFSDNFGLNKDEYGIPIVSANPLAVVVDTLPMIGDDNTIYLVPSENLKYEKWIYVDDKGWESLESQQMINVTYEELVTLRDAGQLIPGQQYRITNYVATTVQENTSAAEHQFDIIVTADSINTLNENARACHHDGDTYFDDCDLNAWELKYRLDNDNDSFSWSTGNIEQYFYGRSAFKYGFELTFSDETLDKIRSYTSVLSSCPQTISMTTSPRKSTSGHMCYYNNNVLIRFKIGTYDNAWGEIENKIYYYDRIPESGDFYLYDMGITLDDCIIKPIVSKQLKENIIARVFVTSQLNDWFYNCFGKTTIKKYIDFKLHPRGGYLDGEPDWYSASIPEILSGDNQLMIPFSPYGIPKSGKKNEDVVYFDHYTGGTRTVPFEISLNRQPIEEECPPIDVTIINNGYVNVPWKSIGKGVIYYMKDEFNNECPYDFKNIKFYRDDLETYVYTFTWIDENYEVMDTSVFGNNGTLTYSGEIRGVYGNVIKPYTEVIYDEDSGDYLGTKQSLNNITFISDYEYEDSGNDGFYGCSYNSFGNNCTENSFENGCSYNSFGTSCSNNSFGNRCSHNSFGNNCTENSFRLSASKTGTLLNYCQYNTFNDGCSYNVIWNSVQPNYSNKLQNINVVRGVSGTFSTYNFINIVDMNKACEIKVAKNTDGAIKIYCEADLIA